MSWVAAAVTAGTAAYKIGSGIHEKNVAGKKQKELAASRGKYSESPYFQQQLALAGSELSGGGKADYEYKQEGDQDLSSSLDAITKMGGTPNDVASVFSSNQQGRARYALLKSNLRLNQISNYQKALEAKEEDMERAFGYNITMPEKDAAAANAQALISGKADVSSGIDTLGSSFASAAETNKATNQLNSYFNQKGVGDNSQDILPRATPNTTIVQPNDTFASPASNPNFQYINP